MDRSTTEPRKRPRLGMAAEVSGPEVGGEGQEPLLSAGESAAEEEEEEEKESR